jgi:SRSO17 transposase
MNFVVEIWDCLEGIGVADETRFLKKGAKSAGVQRPYMTTAGKVENGQIKGFPVYVTRSEGRHLDRRLNLLE